MSKIVVDLTDFHLAYFILAISFLCNFGFNENPMTDFYLSAKVNTSYSVRRVYFMKCI